MTSVKDSVATITATEPVYKDEVLEIEPHGLEHIRTEERHGSPFNLFTLWFAANTVLATWVIGNLAVGVFGESMKGALLGLLVGNVCGGLLLSTLSAFGPRLGVPQMVQSRAAFGFLGNFGPGALNYLAGIGWFAVNTVYGTFALQTLTGMNFFIALAIMVVGQVILAVYGYNMIHMFERVMSILLGVVFLVLAYYTFSKGNYTLPFNPKAPVRSAAKPAGSSSPWDSRSRTISAGCHSPLTIHGISRHPPNPPAHSCTPSLAASYPASRSKPWARSRFPSACQHLRHRVRPLQLLT